MTAAGEQDFALMCLAWLMIGYLFSAKTFDKTFWLSLLGENTYADFRSLLHLFVYQIAILSGDFSLILVYNQPLKWFTKHR